MLVAVEEEAVGLDDPADEHVVPGATLRHLLAHASGYAPERRMRAAAPGTRRIYSNVGIERAAELVEAGADMPFADYLAEAVTGPLRMSGTTLPGSPARDGVSTVADLARVLHELLSPTGLLSAQMLADATGRAVPRPARRAARLRRPGPERLGPRLRAARARSPRTGRAAATPRARTATSASPARCCGSIRSPAWASSPWPTARSGPWAAAGVAGAQSDAVLDRYAG